MDIVETTFNVLWNAMHKSERELLEQLQTLEATSTEAQAVQATLEGLRYKKQNLEAIARDNNFSEEAFSLEDN